MWARALLLLLAVGLPGVMLAPVWRLSGLGADEDDVLYYLPARTFFAESLAAGQWPLLNPWNGLGRPFLADPQTALFYPPTWLFALLPARTAYAASLWLHYTLALLGMYRLLRVNGIERRAALFGGIAFAFSGFLLAHRAHLTIQHAAAWTPWVLWRLQRLTHGFSAARLTTAALLAALQCHAGHVQIAALTALGSLAYLVAWRGRALPALRAWLAAWLACGGLYAVQLLPSWYYLQECTRASRAFWMFVENSWNPLSLVSLLFPMFFGQRTPNFFAQAYWGPSHQCEQFAYPGLVVLILALATLRGAWRADPLRRAAVALLLLGGLTALGQFGPVAPLLYCIPGANIFRVPARAVLLVNLALPLLAASALNDLGPRLSPQRARLRAALLGLTRRAWIWLAVAAGMLLSVLAFAPLFDGAALRAAFQPTNPAIVIPLILLALSVACVAFVARGWDAPQRHWLLTVLLCGDLAIIGWTLDVPAGVNSAGQLLEQRIPSWARCVADSGERLWVVADTAGVYRNPVGKLAANTNALARIAALTDYGPLQPQRLDHMFAFKPWGVSERAAELLKDPLWMQWLRVGWVLLCDEALPAPADCELIERTPEGFRLLRNRITLAPAFVPPADTPAAVHVSQIAPHRWTIVVDCSRPAGTTPARSAAAPRRLVVSTLLLRGWRAEVDGREVALHPAYGALLSVEFDASKKTPTRVELAYQPPGLWAGAAISLTTLTLLLLGCLFLRGAAAAAVRDLDAPRAE